MANRYSRMGWSAMLLAVTLLALPHLPNLWAINRWSVQYLRRSLEGPGLSSDMQAPPPGHFSAPVWLAWEALEAGRPGEALALAQPMAAKGDPFALRVMGNALAAQNDYAGAVQIWEQLGDVNRLLAVADRAAKAGYPEDALLAYRAAYKLDSQKGTLPLADFLWEARSDTHAAETLLRQALRDHPLSQLRSQWQKRLVELLRAQERWDEVEAVYRGVLAEDPSDWRTHIDLGWLYYTRGDGVEAALAELREAIAIAREQGEGYFAIGQLLAREKRYAEADPWFQEALVRKPNARSWYLTRGSTARKAGNIVLALTVYQEAISRFPDFAAAYYEIAWAQRQDDQRESAIVSIEQALALVDPPNADYYGRAGQIYEWAGEKDKALAAFRAALAVDPEHDEARKSVERLTAEP